MLHYVPADVLEEGEVYFLYRPRVNDDTVRGLDDVSRVYMVLHPRERSWYRVLILGRKRLPDVEHGHEREWAFVEGVARTPEGDDLATVKAAYFAAWPDGRNREGLPNMTYIAVRPRWLRYSSFTGTPEIVEFTI